MNQARAVHTDTLLPNGKVLVAGGQNTSSTFATTELYDPAAKTWSMAPPLAQARSFHTATLLPNGKVLLVGGIGTSATLGSTELYDPETNTWSVGAPLAQVRKYHSATLLPNGKVLVVGGTDDTGPLASAELYDPDTGTWSVTAPLAQARYHHTATLLPNGKVLVAGGGDDINRLTSTELYDPATNRWTGTAPMDQARYHHRATLLPNGKVLVVGGAGTSTILTSTELYDPATNSWTSTAPLAQARQFHTVTLLPNGKVLVVGGADQTNRFASTELYDPDTNIWSVTAPLAEARQLHSATLLPDGRVFVAGGLSSSNTPTSSAEVAGPYTTISAGPNWSDNQTTASFTFTGESGASFECSLDGAAFSSCTSPKAYSGLAEGSHTFQVRGRDAAGNLDPASIRYSWTIDLTAPETDLIAAPLSLTNQTMAAFIFDSNELGGSFECSMDGVDFNSCTSPQVYPSLAEGSHTFQVRGRDPLGNVSQKLTSHTWSISRTAPQTKILAAPLATTDVTTAAFVFDSGEPGSSFECSLDEAPTSPCTPMTQRYGPLTDGPHTFRVRVRTSEGSLEWTSYTWIIRTHPPEAPSLEGPTPNQELFSATPVFSGTAQPHSTVTLFIDGDDQEAGAAQVNADGNWSAIPSHPLAWGAHHASAIATDEVGNTSPPSSEVFFSTSRRGYYGLACAASSSTGLASWPWALVLLGFLMTHRRRAPHP